MSISVLCPEGHPVSVAGEKLGGVVICPRCLTSFLAERADTSARYARKEEPKSKRDRDDDDDEDDEEEQKQVKKKSKAKDDDDETGIQEKPSVKAKSASAKKPRDDDEEDEKPRKKTSKSKKDDDDDEEDEKPRKKVSKSKKDDDDEEDDDDEVKQKEEEDPIEWTRKKRQLAIVNTGMRAFIVGYYAMIVTYILLVIFEIPWLFFVVISHLNSTDGKPDSTANFFFYVMVFMGGVGAVPIYVCLIIGWVTGLFSPARAEARSVCITALLMFLGPVFLYLAYFFFANAIIDRPEVADRMLGMFHGFAFISLMMAFYCSFIYTGKIAGYMGLTMEKHKPQALGWFIVGGTMLLTICMVAMLFVPIWALYIVGGFTYNVYYFVITSMRDLIKSVKLIRATIDDHIKYG